MKVTLWQQFSSNHSADFIIVGEFESVEWAENVAKELPHMLLDIAVWRNTFNKQFVDVEDYYRAWDNHKHPTPPEMKFKLQYKLSSWAKSREGERLDWSLRQPKDVFQAVRRFDRFVILDKHSLDVPETWNGAHPFAEIMKQLGGKVALEGNGLFDKYLAVNIQCVVPDSTTMDAIKNDVTESDSYHRRQIGNLQKTRFEIEFDNENLFIQNYAMRPNYATHTSKNDGKGNPEFAYHYLEEELQRLLDYLKSHGCTNIEYEFVEVPFRKDNP
jgi:hypothetical protein